MLFYTSIILCSRNETNHRQNTYEINNASNTNVRLAHVLTLPVVRETIVLPYTSFVLWRCQKHNPKEEKVY